MQIESYEQLVKYLREFNTWGDRGGYDFVGMVNLMGACLDNLRRNATKEDLKEIINHLEPHQWAFLERIVEPDKEQEMF